MADSNRDKYTGQFRKGCSPGPGRPRRPRLVPEGQQCPECERRRVADAEAKRLAEAQAKEPIVKDAAYWADVARRALEVQANARQTQEATRARDTASSSEPGWGAFAELDWNWFSRGR